MGTMHEVGFYEGSIKENIPTYPQSLYGIAKMLFGMLRFCYAMIMKLFDSRLGAFTL